MILFGYQITITKQKQKRVILNRKAWTTEDVVRLTQMRLEGKSNGQIANELGRTTNAVTAKIWKEKKNGNL